jgi:uncharacterized protein (DUF2147 family)
MAYHFRGLKILLLMSSLTALAAADDPFVGTWKVNWGKSQMAGLVIEIKDLGDNRYDWIAADNHNEIIADGKEHPDKNGGTYLLTQESPLRWVLTGKRDGQATGVSVWTLSEDGQQFKNEIKRTRPDGSSSTDEGRWARVGTGSGLAGTWELQGSEDSPFTLLIQPYNDGLSFAYPADKWQQEFKFDGKDYPLNGSRETPGETSSARRIDQRTIQRTSKSNGKVTSTDEWVVSADSRTLTDTRHVPGQKQPIIMVFEKQM